MPLGWRSNDRLWLRVLKKSESWPILMSAIDAVDGSHHRHLGGKVQCRMTGRECLLLAISGLFGVPPRTSALPP